MDEKELVEAIHLLRQDIRESIEDIRDVLNKQLTELALSTHELKDASRSINKTLINILRYLEENPL